jgi:hypothetical protein
VETEAFAKQNHREENRFDGVPKERREILDPLRPSSPPGFRPDGRNGLPENRRNPGRTRASRAKGQRKVNREDEIANSHERSGAKTQQPPPTPKGREKAASASGSGVSAAPFPGAGLKVPSGPLAEEMQKACQMENQEKERKSACGSPSAGKICLRAGRLRKQSVVFCNLFDQADA